MSNNISYRPDLDGVRAIAVLTVIAFHMGAPMSQGGFIGVDIFFVLSGFLITRLLFAEHEKYGKIRLARFWARRARRLLPAATVTTVGTMILTLLFLPATAWNLVARTAIATTLYFANFQFGADTADYFAADVEENPLLHFWSLAVEEQFYMVWPMLIWGVAVLAGKASDRATGAFVLVGALTAVSFGYSLWLTSLDTPWSYYASPARAWEFGVGALVAVVELRRSPKELTNRIGPWVGLALLGVALLTIDHHTAFPGYAALIPVAGSAILCYTMPADGSFLGNVLRSGPAKYIGALSYSLYLWHWPLLVIGQRATGDTSPQMRLGLVALSFVFAAASYHLLENPIRHNGWLSASNARNYALAIGAIVVGLAAAALTIDQGNRALDDPLMQALVEAEETLPAHADCDTNDVADLLDRCTFGSPTASNTVLLVGDSHAGQWQPVLHDLGNELDYKLVVRTRGGCPGASVAATLSGFGLDDCGNFQAGLGDVLDELEPELVVVGNFHAYLTSGTIKTEAGETPAAAWERGVKATIDAATDSGAEVLWMLDQPELLRDPIDCIALNGSDDCSRSAGESIATLDAIRRIEGPQAEGRSNVTAFDPLPIVCGDDLCPLVIDDDVVYRDRNHFSVAFARTFADELRPLVAAALPDTPDILALADEQDPDTHG